MEDCKLGVRSGLSPRIRSAPGLLTSKGRIVAAGTRGLRGVLEPGSPLDALIAYAWQVRLVSGLEESGRESCLTNTLASSALEPLHQDEAAAQPGESGRLEISLGAPPQGSRG
jgi:hypothetical protein